MGTDRPESRIPIVATCCTCSTLLREERQRRHSQCVIFTGIGPAAESNHVTLRIKYGKIPKKTGISPDPAAESKVGYIPYHLSGTQLWLRLPARVRLWPSTGAGRGQYAGSALLRNEAVHTVLTGPCAVSCLVFSAQSARSCRFTLGGVGGRRSQRINLTQAVSR